MVPVLGSGLHVWHVCMDGLNPYGTRTDSLPTLSNEHVLCVNWFDVEPDHTAGR